MNLEPTDKYSREGGRRRGWEKAEPMNKKVRLDGKEIDLLKAFPITRWVREEGREDSGRLNCMLRVVARILVKIVLGGSKNSVAVSWGDSKNSRCVRLGGIAMMGWLKFRPSRRTERERASGRSMGWLKEEPKCNDERKYGNLGSG